METRVTEIADGIHQLSIFIPDVGPTGMRFNQYLIDDEQPLLFHTGHRALFPLVSAAIGSVMPVERLRWIAFGHVEADECGATIRRLADLAPTTLAVMHGSCFTGDGSAALEALAANYDARLAAA